jgi:Tfp pilus assembly protein PilV
MVRRSGQSVLEVLLAVVTLTIGFTALLRVWVAETDAVGVGHRWTAMTAAAASELAELEAAYRAAAPACALPASGSNYTPDGVGLTWSTVDSAGQLAIVLEVRGAGARKILIDTVTTLVPCR